MTKINKARARKLFNEGKQVWIVSCNLRPEYGILLNADCYQGLENDFDKIVHCYEYYNCNRYSGYYSAFYIE